MAELLTAENALGLLTLTALEIILGVDNIVVIAIISGRLEASRQRAARRGGLALAMLLRIGLLVGIGWIIGLTAPLFDIAGHAFSGRDLILLAGGLFLLGKATHEIHADLERPGPSPAATRPAAASMGAALVQIALLDMVFSLDSVITAVGMANEIAIMIAAIVISVAIMFVFVGPISGFVEHHPTIKMLALAFLLLIGVMLVAEGWGTHVDKGYIYFAMGFALLVEMMNLRLRRIRALVAGAA